MMGELAVMKTGMEIGASGFVPRGAADLMEMATFVAKSSLVPEALRGKPADCFLVMATGMEYGFPVFQALQMLHVIKGRVTLPGETCAALIQAHPECAHFRVWFEGEGEKLTAWVQSGRKGREMNEAISFSLADARQAGLSGDNWKKYPKDMLCWKAVARDKRRNWPDLMPGCTVREDLEELAPRNVTPVAEGRAVMVKMGDEELAQAYLDAEPGQVIQQLDPALELLKPKRSRWECHPRLLAACKDRAAEIGCGDRDKATKAGSRLGDALEAEYGPLQEIPEGDKLEGAIEMAVEFER